MTRGFALQYKIRKTTTQNKSGDNFSITIPRFIAKQFSGCLFSMNVSGNSILFESGCKINSMVIKPHDRYVIGGTSIIFK